MAKRDKKALPKRMVVLGLRATPEKRAWLNMKAAKRGLSLQSYFDELMQNQAESPWVRKDHILIAVANSHRDTLLDAEAILAAGGLLAELLGGHIQLLKSRLIKVDEITTSKNPSRGHGVQYPRSPSQQAGTES